MMIPRRPRALRISLALMASLWSACSDIPDSAPYIDDTPSVLAEAPAVGTVQDPDHGPLAVQPARGTHWKQLVDMRLFEGLHPEIGLEDARRRWGEPDTTEQRPLGRCWVYRRQLGTVELCLEEWGSPPLPYTTKWVLHGLPRATRPQDLLDETVMRYLPPDLQERELVIMNDTGDHPAVQLQIRDGKVARMTWFHG